MYNKKKEKIIWNKKINNRNKLLDILQYNSSEIILF